MQDLLQRALDVATDLGATYVDARIVDSRGESLAVNGPAVESLEQSDSLGFGVRVLVDGAWGYSASARLDPAEIARVSTAAVDVGRASATRMTRPIELVPEPPHRATWSTEVKRDPFQVPIEEKVETLVGTTAEMIAVKGIRVARGTMDTVRYRQLFASSEDSFIEQTITQTGAGIEATAVADGEVQVRSYPGSFRGHFGASGYELVEEMQLLQNARKTAEEAVALLRADECPSELTTLVLDGHQVMLQVHESVGHPTELDRVLGMEAAFAGTSFVGIGDLGSLRYGSGAVNITADATIPGGLGSFGFDDEGVEAQRTDLIHEGVLVGFQTSRETAASVGASRSNGTMRAEGWENFPLIRMTNINLLPGEGLLDDLLSDVRRGIFMSTNKSWSIDDKRKNFQFGCEIGWEIKDGRLGRMLKNPRYTGITPEFWGSCDAVAGPDEWKVWGTPNCGKGQPGQTMRVGHGTAPARFRNVQTGVRQ
jgi:TldD protein